MSYLFSSESVTSGHPDKLCDYISDSILDACLSLDPYARVAVEVFVKGLDSKNKSEARSYIIIGGEISINKQFDIDFEKIARGCAIEIGYNNIEIGMDARNEKTCKVIVLISQQSEEISQGVNDLIVQDFEQGAGDQGIIFGYATDESEMFEITSGSYMPLPILLSHRITLEMTKKRMDGTLEWARPDGKSQVTIEYDENGKPKRIDTIVIAIQHDNMLAKGYSNEIEEREFIYCEIKKHIINKVIPTKLLDDNVKIIVNGTGRFCKGGPHADAGLTGRKVIVDTYGGSGRHGGGAFSGKDPTKVDRSAAYAARWAAKSIVANGLAKRCEIQLAYSIGVANPISINVETFSTSKKSNKEIKIIIEKEFDFKPASIIKNLNLRKPIYSITSSGGHFGRIPNENNFTWEMVKKIN